MNRPLPPTRPQAASRSPREALTLPPAPHVLVPAPVVRGVVQTNETLLWNSNEIISENASLKRLVRIRAVSRTTVDSFA